MRLFVWMKEYKLPMLFDDVKELLEFIREQNNKGCVVTITKWEYV